MPLAASHATALNQDLDLLHSQCMYLIATFDLLFKVIEKSEMANFTYALLPRYSLSAFAWADYASAVVMRP